MDERLLRRAQSSGVEVWEEAHAANLVVENGRVCGVKIKAGARETKYRAEIIIDATGRAGALVRRLPPNGRSFRRERAPMVAFKTHLENTSVEPRACEIYFYRRGYGGLSSIESGLSNLCFIVSAKDVRACNADPNRVMREVVCDNQRARQTLEKAKPVSEWLAVSLEGFGRHNVAPA